MVKRKRIRQLTSKGHKANNGFPLPLHIYDPLLRIFQSIMYKAILSGRLKRMCQVQGCIAYKALAVLARKAVLIRSPWICHALYRMAMPRFMDIMMCAVTLADMAITSRWLRHQGRMLVSPGQHGLPLGNSKQYRQRPSHLHITRLPKAVE